MPKGRRTQYLYAHKGWLEYEPSPYATKLATATWVTSERDPHGDWAIRKETTDAEFDKIAKRFGAHP
ncbi:MAG: hypothetical protein QG574_4077 [Cyanobacteriota bacterium erpe_2018_sw_21hr_WHONDRS-SW48-000092_B_bin.40]|jgi:hypothetical protein|nr:hypothetical protein [Cyanobacteriota bacterium erpe_2018_sw_21hr_WHONDRS-SW48-000092_B_bin.40]